MNTMLNLQSTFPNITNEINEALKLGKIKIRVIELHNSILVKVEPFENCSVMYVSYETDHKFYRYSSLQEFEHLKNKLGYDYITCVYDGLANVLFSNIVQLRVMLGYSKAVTLFKFDLNEPDKKRATSIMASWKKQCPEQYKQYVKCYKYFESNEPLQSYIHTIDKSYFTHRGKTYVPVFIGHNDGVIHYKKDTSYEDLKKQKYIYDYAKITIQVDNGGVNAGINLYFVEDVLITEYIDSGYFK